MAHASSDEKYDKSVLIAVSTTCENLDELEDNHWFVTNILTKAKVVNPALVPHITPIVLALNECIVQKVTELNKLAKVYRRSVDTFRGFAISLITDSINLKTQDKKMLFKKLNDVDKYISAVNNRFGEEIGEIKNNYCTADEWDVLNEYASSRPRVK